LAFDEAVEKKLEPSMMKDDFKDDPDLAGFETPAFEHYEDEEFPASKMPDIDDVDTYDQYVHDQVRVPIGDEIRSGKIVRRNRELDGTVKGIATANSMVDTRTYEIKLPDGRNDDYTANVISDNICAQCDEEGNQFNLMECIVDHKTDGHSVHWGAELPSMP
jgi:hypothetical protein